MILKICKTCKLSLPINLYTKDSSVKEDGYKRSCKSCVKAKLQRRRKKDQIILPVKICRSCYVRKDRSEFWVDSRVMDGLVPNCKSCSNKVLKTKKEKKTFFNNC